MRLSWSYPGSDTEVQYYVIQYKPKLASWDYKEVIIKLKASVIQV